MQIIGLGMPRKIVRLSCSTALVFPCIRSRRANDPAAERRANRLVPQAHSQDRNLARKVLDQRNADARFLRRARPRRNHNALRRQRLDLFDRDLVVAPNFHLRAQFAQELHQVVGKRIVIVEDKDHGMAELHCIQDIKPQHFPTEQPSVLSRARPG